MRLLCSRCRLLLFSLALFAGCANLCAFDAVAATKPSPLEMQTEDERRVRWDLSADSVSTLNDAEVMEAVGNVVLRRGNDYLKADFARYYMSTKWVFLKGNVVVSSGKDEISAEEAEFDLRSRTGWLKNGRIFMDGPHTYITGEHITKHWGDMYTFKQARLTTCDGDKPAWSVTAGEAVVEIDGYARLTGVTLDIRNQPIAFSPYMILPVKTSRQTGLLMPEFGATTKKGMYYAQPFFWAIDDSNDMTVSGTWMEKRGFMQGIELRSRPSDDTAGWLRLDWMYDKKSVTNDAVGDFSGDGYARKNHERYWLRGMLDTKLPDPAWRFKADLDYVSDQDYLDEFYSTYGGFKQSRRELFNWFDRDLQEKDRDRVSGLLLTRDWQRASVAFSSQYTQLPWLGHGNMPRSHDTTVQRLPQFDAFLYKGRIFPEFPLEIDGSAQAVYMYRRSGTRGARYEINPRLSLPLTSRYGSVIATGGLTQTLYDTENKARSEAGGTSGPRQNGDTRTVADFGIDATTEFARVYEVRKEPLTASKETLGQSRMLGLKHSIQPRLSYAKRPTEDQDDNPYYDANDRLLPVSELRYGITNVLTGKHERVIMKQGEGEELVPDFQEYYRDLLFLRVEQAYDLNEATRGDERNVYPRRPFGDIFADLVISPWENLSLSTRNDWSPYLGDFTRHQSGFTVRAQEYGSFYLGYDLRNKLDEYKRTRDGRLRYVTAHVRTAALGPLSLDVRYSYDMETADNHETEIQLYYTHQCFQIIGYALLEPRENSFGFQVALFNLGQ